MTDSPVTIHVRFTPSGAVSEISERPADSTPQAWFNCLSQFHRNGYQPLSGGRAVFRISRQDIDLLKSPASTEV